ncbi:MAG: hypothetical protein M1821_008927 [Bathelium mastoideum]|nr:MAG: hypothetical protein M1821_008927 [Bathelium mastoideum]
MDNASNDLPDRGKAAKKGKKDKPEKANKQQEKKTEKQTGNLDTKGLTVTRAEDLGAWCYILDPPLIFAWDEIRKYFDAKIKTIGVRNCYYPLFITRDNLEKEQDHVEGFSAEVAWVERGGKNKLEKPLAVRPTSETAMYKDFADKIHSHRDLPFKRNQWNNVVRWEFSHCTPLLRSREFLWQEGHTAHLTKESADEEVLQILDWYADVYEELLAVPVVKGRKTENEKFPGALYTTTIESYIEANGTSHALGQGFARMYNITVEDPASKSADGESNKLFVWQNSWGLSTRSLGTMLMIHSDDKGAVFPPRVAEFQVAFIPVGITAKLSDADKEKLLNAIEGISKTLIDHGIRVQCDTRSHYSPGWKFAEYELRGFPLRIEYGPKDAEKGTVVTVRRDTGEKGTLPVEGLAKSVQELLDRIQQEMLERVRKIYHDHIKYTSKWDEVVPLLNAKNVIRMPHCGDGDCAEAVKKETAEISKTEVIDPRAPSMGAKALCIPYEQLELPENRSETRENGIYEERRLYEQAKYATVNGARGMRSSRSDVEGPGTASYQV